GGVLSRWFGERRVVAGGFFITAVFTSAIPFAHSLPVLYASQALNGFGQGLCMPVLMGLAIRHIAPHMRATAMGFYQAIYSLGMFGGPAIAGAIGDLAGLFGSFLVIAGISLVSAALTWVLAPGTHSIPAQRVVRIE
ncbi:MAG: MFS transporter, partial [Alicyclobacillus sp.]|nr:MFS transporter [Alicyclobacillus sp.]